MASWGGSRDRVVSEIPEVKASRMVNSFDPLKAKAKDLGFRMAQAGFSESDNPYSGTLGSLAREWGTGFRVYRLISSVEVSKDGSFDRVVPFKPVSG